MVVAWSSSALARDAAQDPCTGCHEPKPANRFLGPFEPCSGRWSSTLVGNGGFEQGPLLGTPSGWTPWQGCGGGPGFVTQAPDPVYAGQRSLRVVPCGQGAALTQTVAVQPGAEYFVSAFFETTDIHIGHLRLDFADLSPHVHAHSVPGIQGWQFVYAHVCVPSDKSTVTLRIVRDDPLTDTGVAFVDEVALTPADQFAPPVSTALPNGIGVPQAGACPAPQPYPTGAWVVAHYPGSMDLIGDKPLVAGQNDPQLHFAAVPASSACTSGYPEICLPQSDIHFDTNVLRGTGMSQTKIAVGFQVDVQSALPGDFVEAIAFTRTELLKGDIALLAIQAFTPGMPPSWPGYPEAHIDPFAPLNAPTLVRLGVLQGCALDESAKQTLQLPGTPGVPLGISAMLQVFVVDPAKATNRIFATSAGHEIRF